VLTGHEETRGLKVLSLLGTDGMSSEESDGEIGGSKRKYSIKLLPWRATAITEWLHRIDCLPHVQRDCLSCSPRPRRCRVLSGLESRLRGPPSNIPISFYQKEWLNLQSPMVLKDLRITIEDFILPPIPAFGHRYNTKTY
jgi:hypothetical protein